MGIEKMPKKFYRKKRKYIPRRKRRTKPRSTALTAKSFAKMYNTNYSNIYKQWIPAPFPTALKLRATWAEKGYTLATVGTGGAIGTPATLPLLRLNDAYEVMYAVVKLSVRSVTPVTAATDDLRFICGISDDSGQYPTGATQEEQCMFAGTQNALLETYNGNSKNRKDFYFKFNCAKWAKRTNQAQAAIAPISNASPTQSPQPKN